MATNPRAHNQKPKGWRKIVVDGVEYWWQQHRSAPLIKRVSDRKMINTWDYLVNVKGWYNGLDRGDISFTPKVIADLIRELPWGELTKRKTK